MKMQGIKNRAIQGFCSGLVLYITLPFCLYFLPTYMCVIMRAHNSTAQLTVIECIRRVSSRVSLDVDTDHHLAPVQSIVLGRTMVVTQEEERLKVAQGSLAAHEGGER